MSPTAFGAKAPTTPFFSFSPLSLISPVLHIFFFTCTLIVDNPPEAHAASSFKKWRFK